MKNKILLTTVIISTLLAYNDKLLFTSDNDSNVVYEITDDEHLFTSLTEILKLLKNNEITKAAILLNNINDDECIFCQVENSRCYKLMQKIKLTLRDQIPQFKNILKSYLQHAVILKKINDESKLDKNQKLKAMHNLQMSIKEAKLIQSYYYIFSIIFDDDITIDKTCGKVLLHQNKI